jgi:hypothetical protein
MGEDWIKVAEREYESELGKRRDYEEEIEKLKVELQKPPKIEFINGLDWSIQVTVNGVKYVVPNVALKSDYIPVKEEKWIIKLRD